MVNVNRAVKSVFMKTFATVDTFLRCTSRREHKPFVHKSYGISENGFHYRWSYDIDTRKGVVTISTDKFATLSEAFGEIIIDRVAENHIKATLKDYDVSIHGNWLYVHVDIADSDSKKIEFVVNRMDYTLCGIMRDLKYRNFKFYNFETGKNE